MATRETKGLSSWPPKWIKELIGKGLQCFILYSYSCPDYSAQGNPRCHRLLPLYRHVAQGLETVFCAVSQSIPWPCAQIHYKCNNLVDLNTDVLDCLCFNNYSISFLPFCHINDCLLGRGHGTSCILFRFVHSTGLSLWPLSHCTCASG